MRQQTRGMRDVREKNILTHDAEVQTNVTKIKIAKNKEIGIYESLDLSMEVC